MGFFGSTRLVRAGVFGALVIGFTLLSDDAVAQSAPTGVSATDGDYESAVRVTWNVVPNARRYRVYRSTTDSFPSSSEIANVTLSSAWDTTAALGVIYYYWVVALSDPVTSPPSESDSGYRWDRRPQEAPSSTSASDGTYPDRVRISWRLVSDATEYEVFRSNSPGGVRTPIGTFSGTTTFDTTGDAGTVYYYSARGKNQWGSGPLSGENAGHRAAGGPPPSGEDYRPDCLIGSNAGRLRGGDVYDASGNRQKVIQRSKSGRRLSWFASFENDGTFPDNLNGRGRRGSPYFSVKYLKGNQNITAAMFAGRFQANLASGQKCLIRIDVKPTRRARGKRKARTFAITLNSTGEPTLKDRAKPIAKTVK